MGTARNSTSIILQWDYPLCPHGIPTHYNVSFVQGSDAQSPPITSDGYMSTIIPILDFTTVHTLTDLLPGAMYKIHVRAVVVQDGQSGEVDMEIVVELQTSTSVQNVDPITGERISSGASSSTTTITTRLPSIAAFAAQGIVNIT